MSNDLTQRLRDYASAAERYNDWGGAKAMREAADRIEELQGLVEKVLREEGEAFDRIEALEAALREISTGSPMHLLTATEIARRALEGK